MSRDSRVFVEVEDFELVFSNSNLVEKHGTHDQKKHGLWAHGGSVIDGLLSRLSATEDSGFSIRIKTKKAPKSGYMVSDDGAERVTPAKEFFSSREISKKIIKDYIRENSDALSQRGAYLGGWHEKKTGKVFLDVSRRYDTRRDAVYALFDNNQISAYDVENDSYIYAKDEVDDRTTKARREQSSLGGSSKTSQSNDGRGIGQVRRRDSGSDTGQPLRHICLGRSGLLTKHLEGQHDQRTHGNWAGERYPEDSVKSARDGALEYVYKKGLKYDQTIDYNKVVANRERASRIADLYEKLPVKDVEAIDEYEALASEVEEQFDFMTKNLGIKVEFVPDDPYKTSQEMFADVSKGTLKVLQTASTGAHPLFSDKQNDKFRAVHDYFGHAATGRGFGQDGEEAAWVHHSQMFTEKARGALTTETRGQNSFFNNRGRQFAEQKVALLPSEFWNVPASFAKELIIRFQAGLRPIVKHLPGQHPQERHGRWAEQGYTEEQVRGIENAEGLGPKLDEIEQWLQGITEEFDPDAEQIRLYVQNHPVWMEVVDENIQNDIETWIEEFSPDGISEEKRNYLYEQYREDALSAVEDSYRDDIINEMAENSSSFEEAREELLLKIKDSFSEVYNVSHTSKNEDGEEITLNSQVEDVSIEEGRLFIQGQVYDQDGNLVSSGNGFVRSWYYDGYGDLVQEHDYFMLLPSYRGTGFGKVFVDASENWATQAGIEKIVVGTAWDGARHWARMGYDFREDYVGDSLADIYNSVRGSSKSLTQAETDEYISLFQRATDLPDLKMGEPLPELKNFSIAEVKSMKDPNFPTPHEFAMVGYQNKDKNSNGNWAGKRVMADLNLKYEKVLTAEGRTIPQGPIDRDGDGLVYDGTSRERPATGGEAK